MAEDTASVKERVDRHEDRLNKHDEVLSILGQKVAVENNESARFSMALRDFNESIKSLDGTMLGFKIEMITLANSVNENVKTTKGLSVKVGQLEEKGIIDWQLWIKNNFGKIIVFFILLMLAYPKVAEIFMSVF